VAPQRAEHRQPGVIAATRRLAIEELRLSVALLLLLLIEAAASSP
jgi:hypothetical protein